MSDQSVIMFIVVSMILLLIISISVMWFFYHTQNKILNMKMLEQANDIKYHKNLLLNTVKTQEIERNRISCELHDDVASGLNVIHLNIHLLKRKISDQPELKKIIDQVETSLNESIRRTRVISHELVPPLLQKFGFQHAFHELVRTVNATGVVQMNVEDEHLCSIDDEYKQLHLIRIIQELISNTLKYAQASNIKVEFEILEEEDCILMKYSDDGIGFDPDLVSTGLGLDNIKTRIELLGGEGKFIVDNQHKGVLFILKFRTNE